MRLISILLFLFAIISCVSADTRSIFVQPDFSGGSTWSLSRQSQNISLNLTSSVTGTIAPLEYHSNYLHPCQSIYRNIIANDVRLNERNSALEGNYSSEEFISLDAQISSAGGLEYVKPPGTNIWIFTYTENWPVVLTSSRSLKYSGMGINDHYLASNNLDFICSNLLYNRQLSENQRTIMWLNNLNATILAADHRGIIDAELQPNKYLGNLMQAHTTGIADLSYRVNNPHYDAKRKTYPASLEGSERYTGTYDLAQRIETRSNNTIYDYDSYDWLPCSTDWNDISLGTGNQGLSSEELFDYNYRNS